MNWNDVKATWAGQTLGTAPLADPETLRRDFEAKRRRLARGLFWRDGREAAAGLLVAGVFGYLGWNMGPAGWPIAVAVVLMLGLTAFFLRERIRARRIRVGADAALTVKVVAEIAELRRQRGLLWSVGTWYLGPCLGAGALVAATTLIHAPIPLALKLVTGGAMAAILALTGWGVWMLNRWSIRKNLDPRLEELEQLRQSLLSLS